MAGIKILGYGLSRGDEKVTNFDLEKKVDTSDEWIREKTGIESRFFARNKTNLDMAAEAGREAVMVGSFSAFVSIIAIIEVVVVLPCVPEIAIPSRYCSMSIPRISALGSIGIPNSAAIAISGLSILTADE